METISSGNDALIETRFSELAFLLRFFKDVPFVFCEEKANGKREDFFLHRPYALSEELDEILPSLNFKKIEVLYIYGIGLGHYAFRLLDWLEEDQTRDLVFLEDDLEVLRLFFQREEAENILNHPQIHIRFMMDKKNWKHFLEECAYQFPTENIELIALESYRKTKSRHFNLMRLHLMRRSTIHNAIHIEEKFHHLFFKNIFLNIKKIPSGFYVNHFEGAFQNIPALICGAGPSLENDLEIIRSLESNAVIFAGGSAIAALSHAGVFPHFGVAIDPNDEEYERFKFSSAFESPLLYTNRLFHRVFETCNGPNGYIQAKTGGPVENWLEKKLQIEEKPLQEGFDIEALSVTTTCIEVAAMMGCNPIILTGVDLAFTNQKSYALGIVNQNEAFLKERKKDQRAPERLIKRKDLKGNSVYTLVKWVMESEAISKFAKKNSHLNFINATSGGIGFKDIPYHNLKELSFASSYDIRGKVHQLIQKYPANVTSQDLKAAFETLKISLQKAQEYIDQALLELERVKNTNKDPENGKLVFYQMELESVDAYKCFLEIPAMSFQKSFKRNYRFASWKASEYEKNAYKWKFLHTKWKTFKELITFYLDEFFTK